jgi:hypothetical protein
MDYACIRDHRFAELYRKRAGNAQYLHSDIQNELIDLCADQIIDQIISQIKRSKYFSLIADETSDRAKHEQLTIVLRYLNDHGKYIILHLIYRIL